MNVASSVGNRNARLLSENDVERVIAIDCAHSGLARRHFFEKRFAAAKAQSDDYIHVGVMGGGSLRGFAIARILRGEFGHGHAVAVLDAIGVAAESLERGIGQALMEELSEILRRRGVRSLETQANWTNHDLLRFFESSGFELAPRFSLQRSVAELLDEASEEV